MESTVPSTVRAQKRQARQLALRARDALASDERMRKSACITKRLLCLPAVQFLHAWFVYVSYKSEVDTHALIDALLAAGKAVAVPLVDGAAKKMTPSLIHDYSRDLAPGSLGILEPKPDRRRPLSPDRIEVAVVPGAAFAPDGWRIGYGGGYYDRFLKCSRCLAVGLSFEAQITPFIPHDAATDMAVQYVITESRILEC